MTLEQKVDYLLQEVRTIRRVVMPEQKQKWVRVGTIMEELKLTREQVRYARLQNPKIARKKASGQYEYNIEAYKNLPA